MSSGSAPAKVNTTVVRQVDEGGFEVIRVDVGGIRLVAHHSDRATSAPPAVTTGSNPPPGIALDQGRKPRSATRPLPMLRTATSACPQLGKAAVFARRPRIEAFQVVCV